VTPFVGWALVRRTGLKRGWPTVQLIAFTPYAAGAAVVVAVGLLLARRRVAGAASAGVVASVAALALVAVLLPRVLADGGALPTGPTLRVLSTNLLAGSGDERAVLDLVRRWKVDVLAVQEFTPADAAGLATAGVDGVLPHRAAYPRPGVTGSALYSRHPVRDGGLRVHRGGFTQAYATVLAPGAPPVEVESVHPTAPSSRQAMPHWVDDYAAQPPATPNGPIRILAGDFNATLDHAVLRRLIDTGYRDAAEVVGAGFRPTWPYDEKWYLPGVTIDRVLADRRVGVRAVEVFRIPGSDHRACYAELVLPPALATPPAPAPVGRVRVRAGAYDSP
jgi:endonuclease/exonuclease/phosphatase (EEP) superfamily protein YafD